MQRKVQESRGFRRGVRSWGGKVIEKLLLGAADEVAEEVAERIQEGDRERSWGVGAASASLTNSVFSYFNCLLLASPCRDLTSN